MPLRIVLYSSLPVAGAPFQQFQCLKNYAPQLEVHYITKKNKYGDGRVFPYDILLSNPQAEGIIRKADIVHLHNDICPEITRIINKKCQKVVATLHSAPKHGRWASIIAYADKTFSIRQPLQQREYPNLPTLPNLFNIFEHMPLTPKNYRDPLRIVYCPTNKHKDTTRGSKGYFSVMPVLRKILTDNKGIQLIHHFGMNYYENLEAKRLGHICIDDICNSTWHLTSIEGCSFGQAVLTSVPEDVGYPFIYTTLQNLRKNLQRLIHDREYLEERARVCRQWTEKEWNPRQQVLEYVKMYEELLL